MHERCYRLRITVKPYLFLRSALGAAAIDLDLPEGSKVFDLLVHLRSEYGLPESIDTAYGRLLLFENDHPSGLTILVDGQSIRQMQGIITPLREGSVISIFPPSAGG